MNPITSSTSATDSREPVGMHAGTTDELVLAVGERWHQLHRRHKALKGRLLTTAGSASAELAATVRHLADAYGITGRALDAARPGATPTVAELAIKLRDALAIADEVLAASQRLSLT